MFKTIRFFYFLSMAVAFVSPVDARAFFPDGTYLKAVDGVVIHDANTGLWQFKLQDKAQKAGLQGPGAAAESTGLKGKGVKNHTATLANETQLILLPNEQLQALIADVTKYPDATCRLWARATEYASKNYLWISNHLMLTQTPRDTPQVQDESDTAASDRTPANRLDIPESVRRTVSRQRAVRPGSHMGTGAESSSHVLLDRVGHVGSGDRSKMFVFDGFGLSSHESAIRLLPSRALQQMEREQARSSEAYRFCIAGITSTFEGKTYLLVQRAYRVYSYGNFTP